MIETVPFISDINITERTILYSDKILNLKENDILLCITTINNISPYMLENKIEEIFNTHKDVNYYMIQYNEKDKLLIFYTYEPLINNNKTIMKQENLIDNNLYNYYEEIQKEFYSLSKIESMIPLKNENTVSLQDIINTFYIMNQEYENQIKNTKTKFANLLIKREKKQLESINIELNFDKDEIKYSYHLSDNDENRISSFNSEHYRITIKIIKNKLFLTNFYKNSNGEYYEENYQKNKILKNYETIKEIIINILKYKEFKTKIEQKIQSINNNIILNINNYYGTYNLYYKNNNPNFSIEINEKETTINSESLELYHYLSENLDIIKEQLFFRKTDCPIWMQEYWEKNKETRKEFPKDNKEMEPVVKKLSDEEETTYEDETTYEEPQIETEKVYIRKSLWPFKKK